jgi:bifunctional DNase/RNase
MGSFVPIEIISIATSFSNRNGYSVVMKEIGGNKRLQMIVGVAEAQSIVVSMEKIITSRPMTHHFLENIISEYSISLKNILIHKYEEGVYFANAMFDDGFGNVKAIDCRPSDAICIALRMDKPILVEDSLFELSNEKPIINSSYNSSPKGYENLSITQLQLLLTKALESEDFETASLIQEEIKKR